MTWDKGIFILEMLGISDEVLAQKNRLSKQHRQVPNGLCRDCEGWLPHFMFDSVTFLGRV